MTRQEWLAEVARRIGISEGCRSTMYRDTMGIPTIGIGYNLRRSDARDALKQCGVTNIDGVLCGVVALTPAQIQALFEYSFKPIESEARASLNPGIYDTMTDARRFVICDLVFNLGDEGWSEFGQTRWLLNVAQAKKNAGDVDAAHALFEQAGAHLQSSAWFAQVGDRARRDVAMIRSGEWCSPTGDGTT